MSDVYAVLVAAGFPEIRAARLVDLMNELDALSFTGPEAEYTATELDLMAEIGPEDIEDARTDWYVSTEPAFARLLDARGL